jgi:hypothetical protein
LVMMCGMSGRSICKMKWTMVCTICDQRGRCEFLTCETVEEDDGSAPKVIADKSVPWPLHHDQDGYPTLPDMVGKSLPDLKDIVRSFVTLSYRMCLSFIQLLWSDYHII